VPLIRLDQCEPNCRRSVLFCLKLCQPGFVCSMRAGIKPECDHGLSRRLSDVLRISLWREATPKGTLWLPNVPWRFAKS